LEIGGAAFFHCSSLSAICIPASVEVFHLDSFAECWGLCHITFASKSHLARVIVNRRGEYDMSDG
jgi:hypothetical protein